MKGKKFLASPSWVHLASTAFWVFAVMRERRRSTRRRRLERTERSFWSVETKCPVPGTSLVLLRLLLLLLHLWVSKPTYPIKKGQEQ